MGNDGLIGATEVQQHGGRILAEAEESCTVYGMPRAIVEAKLANDVMPLDELADAIQIGGRLMSATAGDDYHAFATGCAS